MSLPLPPIEDRPHPATRQGFLVAYRAALLEAPYAWVRMPGKLDEYMEKVHKALASTDANPHPGFDCTGLCATQAWRAIGNATGLATMAKLRALPDISPPPDTLSIPDRAVPNIEHLPPNAQRAIMAARTTTTKRAD